jgi:hypothetical protein
MRDDCLLSSGFEQLESLRQEGQEVVIQRRDMEELGSLSRNLSSCGVKEVERGM